MFSCKQSCGVRKSPASCLFVHFHLTLGQQTTPPSCLNILTSVSMWMTWFCFEKALCSGGFISYHPYINTPTSPSYPLYHAHITHTRTRMHTFPFPLLLHNGFTRRWPCSNEVWSFCDATGKLPRGTVLSILVHHLKFFSALKYLSHFVLPTSKNQTNFYKHP